jgi:hypothetical protein
MNTKRVFLPADILLPKTGLENWAVVACDQYSSQPDYWLRVEERVKDSPSALNLILPEAWLGGWKEQEHQQKIAQKMQEYQENDVFQTCENSFVYVEKTLQSGKVRCGLVGMVDLEAYDFHKGSASAIRATEETILERIPPRVAIREKADLELPHILMLADDPDNILLGSLQKNKSLLPLLYDFDLMENGGHITGYLVSGENLALFEEAYDDYVKQSETRYADLNEYGLRFAVGDGNHSLATAKACWEKIKPVLSEEEAKTHPARFALAELENLHDEALEFEPIHRILTEVDTDDLLEYLKQFSLGHSSWPVKWYTQEQEGILYLDPSLSQLPAALIQQKLDAYLKEKGGEIDYIHGEEALKALSHNPQSIGLQLPQVDKASLFRTVIADGALPRKTFSMGHAHEKRYYLEARKIK